MTAELRTACEADIKTLKKLWLSCFEDSEEAAGLFFERNKDTYHAYVAEADERLVSALYLIDCKLGGENAHYLCGAATLPEFRKRGIMSALIEYALNDAKGRGDRYSVLLPASEGLYRYYGALGYRTSCTVSIARFIREQLSVGVGFDRPVGCESSVCDFERLQNGFNKENFLYWNNDFIKFAIDYYALYGVRAVHSQNVLALYEEANGVCTVLYTIYNDIKELKALLLNSTTAKSYVILGKSGEKFFDDSKKEKYGMARALTAKPLPKDIYIGITLD